MGIQIGGLIGLFGGIIFGLVGWFIGRKKAKKERSLDELHDYVWTKARSYSWYVTLVAIYVFFTLYLFGYEMSVAMILALLILVQLASWGISGAVLSVQLSRESDSPSYQTIIGFIIILVSFIIFFTLAIILENWIYVLGVFIFGAIGSVLITKGNKLTKGGS